jgi:hypothetical protein
MAAIHEATFDDLTYIGSWLCAADRRELSLTRDADDYVALANDALRSTVCKVVLDDSALPVMAFGARTEGDTAIVWGFKTDRAQPAVSLVTRYINRVMIPVLRDMGVRRAVCIVHPENRASQDWLQRLGFHPEATRRDIGPHQEEVVLFRRDEPDAAPTNSEV